MKITRIIFLTAAVTVSQGYAQAEKEIYLKKGETARIEEESNPTTGYTWQVLPLPENAPISIVDKGHEPKEGLPANQCGAPGKAYWIIKADDNLTKRQIIKLVLHNKRQWLKDEEPAKVQHYTIYIH